MAIKPWDPNFGVWPGGIQHFTDASKKPDLGGKRADEKKVPPKKLPLKGPKAKY